MKTGISIVFAALVLAVFAMPDAHAWWHKKPDISLRGFGGIFVTSSENGTPTPLDGRPFTSMANGITKGSGSPVFLAQPVFAEQFTPDLTNCTQEMPLRGDVTGSNVLTYDDGSILQLGFTGSFCCTDGVAFACDLAGEVVGGRGRFEGATGTYEGTGSAESGVLTFQVTVDLD
ncbi:MAG: hypothetical protein WAU39_16825 [Polyangiales bacterium]